MTVSHRSPPISQLQRVFRNVYGQLGAKHVTFEIRPPDAANDSPVIGVRTWLRRWKNEYSQTGMTFFEASATEGVLIPLLRTQETQYPLAVPPDEYIEKRINTILAHHVVPDIEFLQAAMRKWAEGCPGWRVTVEFANGNVTISATVRFLDRCNTSTGTIRKFRYQPWIMKSTNVHPETAGFLLQNAITIIRHTIDIQQKD